MAYDFNGTNQRMSVSSSPVTGLPLTIAAWFNLDSVNTLQLLAAVYNTSAATKPYYGLYVRGDVAGCPIDAFAFNGSLSDFARTTAGCSQGAWTHGCAVFSSTTSRTAYINGASQATSTATISEFTPADLTISHYVLADNSIGGYVDGRMAEIAIWSAVLTAAEVAALSRGFTPSQIRPQSLQFYAPLVRNLQDVRGGRTITNVNSATVATHPRVIT